MGEALRISPSAPPRPIAEIGTWRGALAARVPAVELLAVGKHYPAAGGGTIKALDAVSLIVEPGTLALIRGPSGSGKTTLLQLAAGILRPSCGRIRIAGREITRLTEDSLAPLRRRCLGFVFQSPLLIRGASALANVMLPALPDPAWNGDLRPQARALLARFGLANREREPVERLSGGERQRVGIARALVQDPPVVLADEPTSHLDPDGSRAILDLLEELREEGRTVIVASHDPQLRESRRFDRVVELREGRIEGSWRPRWF